MRFITALFSLFFISSSLNAQLSLGSEMNHFLTMEYTVDFEVKEWSDSIEYQFLVITVKLPVSKDTSQHLPFRKLSLDQYYCDLSEFYVKRDDCRLYPIRFKNEAIFDTTNNLQYATMKGLYLVDDFKSNPDSLELTLLVHSGYELQNQVNSYNHHVEIEYNPLKVIDSTIPVATKKKYKAWLNTNPKNHDPRSHHLKYSRGGCED